MITNNGAGGDDGGNGNVVSTGVVVVVPVAVACRWVMWQQPGGGLHWRSQRQMAEEQRLESYLR